MHTRRPAGRSETSLSWCAKCRKPGYDIVLEKLATRPMMQGATCSPGGQEEERPCFQLLLFLARLVAGTGKATKDVGLRKKRLLLRGPCFSSHKDGCLHTLEHTAEESQSSGHFIPSDRKCAPLVRARTMVPCGAAMPSMFAGLVAPPKACCACSLDKRQKRVRSDAHLRLDLRE